MVEGGRCCSLLLHRLVLVASCCSLLACLVSLSCLVGASYLHLFGLGFLELGSSLCRCECEREIEVEEMEDDALLDRDARIIFLWSWYLYRYRYLLIWLGKISVTHSSRSLGLDCWVDCE